jgi:hypothetical protein
VPRPHLPDLYGPCAFVLAIMRNVLRERHTQPPSDRMHRIHEWINGGKYPNAVTMGKDLEVVVRLSPRAGTDRSAWAAAFWHESPPLLARNARDGDKGCLAF